MFAALHTIAFASFYVYYVRNAGTWFADLPLVLLSMPFILPMRWLAGGSYSYAGDMTGLVAAAAVVDSALAYVVGWGLERLVRAGLRALRLR